MKTLSSSDNKESKRKIDKKTKAKDVRKYTKHPSQTLPSFIECVSLFPENNLLFPISEGLKSIKQMLDNENKYTNRRFGKNYLRFVVVVDDGMVYSFDGMCFYFNSSVDIDNSNIKKNKSCVHEVFMNDYFMLSENKNELCDSNKSVGCESCCKTSLHRFSLNEKGNYLPYLPSLSGQNKSSLTVDLSAPSCYALSEMHDRKNTPDNSFFSADITSTNPGYIPGLNEVPSKKAAVKNTISSKETGRPKPKKTIASKIKKTVKPKTNNKRGRPSNKKTSERQPDTVDDIIGNAQYALRFPTAIIHLIPSTGNLFFIPEPNADSKTTFYQYSLQTKKLKKFSIPLSHLALNSFNQLILTHLKSIYYNNIKLNLDLPSEIKSIYPTLDINKYYLLLQNSSIILLDNGLITHLFSITISSLVYKIESINNDLIILNEDGLYVYYGDIGKGAFVKRDFLLSSACRRLTFSVNNEYIFLSKQASNHLMVFNRWDVSQYTSFYYNPVVLNVSIKNNKVYLLHFNHVEVLELNTSFVFSQNNINNISFKEIKFFKGLFDPLDIKKFSVSFDENFRKKKGQNPRQPFLKRTLSSNRFEKLLGPSDSPTSVDASIELETENVGNINYQPERSCFYPYIPLSDIKPIFHQYFNAPWRLNKNPSIVHSSDKNMNSNIHSLRITTDSHKNITKDIHQPRMNLVAQQNTTSNMPSTKAVKFILTDSQLEKKENKNEVEKKVIRRKSGF
ncbi:hypothetical protein CDIK_3471 [Cucumispora dikerogammari]|nr:hypothetical protein CDIK_3471 [Cucumispora dikerogammari]